MRRCRSLALPSIAIAAIWLCCLICIRAAETTGLFHPDAQHISNRLYRELHVRKEPNGKEHGFDALDLALSPDDLAQLPDTYVRALQNHEFPAAYDPANPNQAFLPPDLFDTRGPWVCLGAPDHDLAAPVHDLSFLHVPYSSSSPASPGDAPQR